MFELRPAEKAGVVANCIHLARLKFSPAAPLVFTEHGALMAASVLNTPRAIEVSVYVVRAFVRLNQALTSHKDLARRLDQIEARTDARFKAVFDALRDLMTPAEPKRRPIGFVHPKEEGGVAAASAGSAAETATPGSNTGRGREILSFLAAKK